MYRDSFLEGSTLVQEEVSNLETRLSFLTSWKNLVEPLLSIHSIAKCKHNYIKPVPKTIVWW